MIYVGIDIAKQTHYAAIMNSDGEILSEPFAFSNDYSGFNKLLQQLNNYSKDQLYIGMESMVLCQEKAQIKYALFRIELSCQSFCSFV